MSDIDMDFLHLARYSLEGKTADAMALIRKTARGIIRRRPELAQQVEELLIEAPNGGSVRSKSFALNPIPVDADSRLELVRSETLIRMDSDPVWPESIKKVLFSVVAERQNEMDLVKAGLSPSKTMLLYGPPGVGKTLSAKWLAMKLGRPLLILDLAAVMSSFLGKTGNNIRSVLEFAKKSPSVLLLDEFDAIAKKRDDSNEVGELKRLVTVILQAVDDWPSSGMLLAATNHPELLDPAVWRRFDRVVEFPKPNFDQNLTYIKNYLSSSGIEVEDYDTILAGIFSGLSFAETEKHLNTIMRESIIEKRSVADCLGSFISVRKNDLSISQRLEFAKQLEKLGRSQREIHDITGCSRDTLREHGIGVKKQTRKAG